MFFADSEARQKYYDWLSNLKVGDSVALANTSRWSFRCPYEICTITRETPKFFEVAGCLYSKKDGSRRGDSGWYAYNIEPVTPKILEAVKRYNLVATIDESLEQIEKKFNSSHNTYSMEELEKAKELVDKLKEVITNEKEAEAQS